MGGAPRWQGRTHIVGVGGHTHMGGDPEVAGSYSHSGGGGGGCAHMGGDPEVAGSYSHSGGRGPYSHGRGPRGGRVVLT